MATARPMKAVEAEATGADTVSFKWHDLEFTIAASADDWPLDVTEAFEDGKVVTAVRGILGDEQWRSVKALNLKNRDLEALYDAISVALGLKSAGESSAS